MTDNANATVTTRNAIATTSPVTLPAKVSEAAALTPAEVISEWLASMNANSRTAYAADLKHWAIWVHGLDPDMDRTQVTDDQVRTALLSLCDVAPSVALRVLMRYQSELKARDLSSATINRRVTVVNSALRTLHRADIGPGRLDIKNVKHELRGDTRGPAIRQAERAIEECVARLPDPEAARDLAVLVLAIERGLRRSEICDLTFHDVNLIDKTIRIRRKGRREAEVLEITDSTAAALKTWIGIRGDVAAFGEEGLFISLANRNRGHKLSAQSIYNIVQRAGVAVGQTGWRPHKLRHTAISEVLRRTGNSLAAAQEFAGHASSTTTARYIDDRKRLEREAVASMDGIYRVDD